MSGTRAQTAGLLLAAGGGTRFGGRKMLADVSGRPMLQHVLDLAAAAELDPVVVVLGEDADEVEAALQWRRERRVVNPDRGRGISGSVALGLAELAGADRALVLLGDQPFLSVENVRVIADTVRDPARPIVVPRYRGVPGNPVLLEREAWSLVQALEGDRGMSQLFATHPELVRHVEVPGHNPDIDTPRDLERLTERSASVADDTPGAFVLRPGDGRSIDLGNFAMSLKADEGATRGGFSLLEASEPPNFGPPMHIHSNSAEAFYVLEGVYNVFIGSDRHECAAGSFILIPQGVEHGFRVGAVPSRKLNIYTPAAMVGYFDDLSEAITSGDTSDETLSAIARKHGMVVTGPVPEGYV